MIRQFLALLLVVTTVWSSGFAQTSDAASPVLVDRKTDYPHEKVIRIVRRENKLRQGHDAEFAVLLSSPSTDCLECLPALLEEGDQPILKSLKLDPSAGFSVRYAERNAKRFKSVPQGKLVYTQAGPAILLKIHADKNLKAGDYALAGKANLTVIHRGKPVTQKEISLIVPLTVTDENDKTTMNTWTYLPHPRNTSETTTIILAFTIFLPITLVFLGLMVACSALTNDCF